MSRSKPRHNTTIQKKEEFGAQSKKLRLLKDASPPKNGAEKIIPFDDEIPAEAGKVGTTDGF